MDIFTSHPFPPFVPPDSRLLILGSFPSPKSREVAFYYGNPQNRFWTLLAEIYHESVPMALAEKQSLLTQHHLALYDVVGACAIQGASDASLSEAKPTDLSFLPSSVRLVLLNGKRAGTLYERFQAKHLPLPYRILPSTSPANAAFSLEKLRRLWSPSLLNEE